MERLIALLQPVCEALLLPVVLLLLALAAWSLAALGGLLREAFERRGTGGAAAAAACGEARACAGRPLELRRLADDFELDVEARLGRLVLVARVAPMLGLMGTLIPLGPALLGLSQGRLDELARSLVVSFGTTVIGLFAAGMALALSHVRRGWYARDLAAVEQLCEALEEAPAS